MLTGIKELIMCMDIYAYNLIVENLRSDILTGIMKFITNFGGTLTIIILTVLSFVVIKNKKIGMAITTNILGISPLNVLLKNIVQRPRPEGFRLIEETGYSFPSGHSMISMAFYGLIIYFVYKKVANKKNRNILCIALGIFVALIGISRIYLGVHYASDVIAGFLISIVYLIIFIPIMNKVILKKDNKNG